MTDSNTDTTNEAASAAAVPTAVTSGDAPAEIASADSGSDASAVAGSSSPPAAPALPPAPVVRIPPAFNILLMLGLVGGVTAAYVVAVFSDPDWQGVWPMLGMAGMVLVMVVPFAAALAIKPTLRVVDHVLAVGVACLIAAIAFMGTMLKEPQPVLWLTGIMLGVGVIELTIPEWFNRLLYKGSFGMLAKETLPEPARVTYRVIGACLVVVGAILIIYTMGDPPPEALVIGGAAPGAAP